MNEYIVYKRLGDRGQSFLEFPTGVDQLTSGRLAVLLSDSQLARHGVEISLQHTDRRQHFSTITQHTCMYDMPAIQRCGSVVRHDINCLKIFSKIYTYFCERVVNIWNRLPSQIVDFSSLSRFRKSIEIIELEVLTNQLIL